MSIKTIIDNARCSNKDYPKLMKHQATGTIIIALSNGGGPVVRKGGTTHLGHNVLSTAGFEDFNEPVTLINE